MVGLQIGRGSWRVSITAGAHSDEPVGPITAMELAMWLVSKSAEPAYFCANYTFYICPQVNPDGAALNAAWFAEPLDAVKYFRSVVREAPGDDIEFGYPGNGGAALRPENEAVAKFLGLHGPFVFHASLHGMAFAEGAWFLICEEWAERSAVLRQTLARLSREAGFPLHDIDRQGDKGFTRIEPGFCTTPTSTAMRSHFLDRDETKTAAQFRPSSMEFVQSLGGDPLLMVSELPLFMITDPHPRTETRPPVPGETAYEKFREALPLARAAFERGDTQPVETLMQQYRLRAVPTEAQVTLQGRMVLESAEFARSRLS